MILFLISAFIGIAFYEAPGLIRKKLWPELAAFSVFLLLAFVISLLQTVGVKIPSPMKGAQYLIEEVLHLGYK